MALSDQLTQLATRAKDLEDRAAAAKAQTKAELESEVKNARESAQQQADALRTRAETSKGEISEWWDDVRTSWSKHVSDVRDHVDDRRAAHDLKSARHAAERAAEDAAFAVSYAYTAIEEAEYAVLDAYLARMEADELEQVS
ncbi:MAG: YtxH domain-containing protein [Acidimicrobiales bacterium]